MIINGSFIFVEENIHCPHCHAIGEESSGIVVQRKRNGCKVVAAHGNTNRGSQNAVVLQLSLERWNYWSWSFMLGFVRVVTLRHDLLNVPFSCNFSLIHEMRQCNLLVFVNLFHLTLNLVCFDTWKECHNNYHDS